MNFIIFTILIIFQTYQFSQADLSFEEKQKEKIGIHFNKSEWMTKDLFNLELLTIGQMEKLTHPVLKEIRLQTDTLRKTGKNPSECIHQFSKALLSYIDEFYDELDQCNTIDNHLNNVQDAHVCYGKVVSAFKSLTNGVKEYFKHCVKNL